MLKVMPTTLTSDVTVRLEDPSKAYYLEEGRRITVDFVLDSAGGCFLDYSGSHGTVR
jgi:hypothetical protein